MIGSISKPQGIRPFRFGEGIGAIGGDTYRQAVVNTGPVSYWRLGEAAASTVSDISVANPTHITTSTPHGILNGATVVISGSVGGVLSINGTNVATVLDATHFTIPVAVTVAGSGGTVNILYAVDEMGAHNGTYVGSPTLGVAGLLTGDANTAVTRGQVVGTLATYATTATPASIATLTTVPLRSQYGLVVFDDAGKVLRFEDVFLSFVEDGAGKTVGEYVIPMLEQGRLLLPKGAA